jgi:uncharacterized protein with ParB-like and HNH nuclease domain
MFCAKRELDEKGPNLPAKARRQESRLYSFFNAPKVWKSLNKKNSPSLRYGSNSILFLTAFSYFLH